MNKTNKIPPPCLMIIFGATGDLTARKLIPSLYHLFCEGFFPTNFACIAFARRCKNDEMFRDDMASAVKKYSHKISEVYKDNWEKFSSMIFYHQGDFSKGSDYEGLKSFLYSINEKCNTQGNFLFYLSTPSSYFSTIIENLHSHGLIKRGNEKSSWSRIIIEKPFGSDLSSAQELQQKITNYVDEKQIYRIDHYLGKETVQNLLIFRFSNRIFESLWNRRYIDNVQITVSENIGIENRGKFFEETGLLRDIVQNHMMQLLALVAMEPPITSKADDIRNEKVKVLKSIRPINVEKVVRGQYSSAEVDDRYFKGYRNEEFVSPHSSIETFVACKVMIDNWRWEGVPFFLRAGKGLPRKSTEISIFFKHPPRTFFDDHCDILEKNVLTFKIQPNEGIWLKVNAKIPGVDSEITSVKMDFRYKNTFNLILPEAYERLLCDCMVGDNTLFARGDEVITCWKLFTPVLKYWESKPLEEKDFYPFGSWGTKDSENLLTNEGKQWRLI